MKEEALELADFLEKNMVASVAILGDVTATYIVSTIRRLVEELDKHKDMLAKHQDIIADWDKKPLSDNEIHDIWKSLWEGGNIGHIAYNYARAIEERHGIK